ncbi:hypothetical protein [Singulisphaera sp. GP187]|uniref:hypothetical protein n=1 Tax=Singulisphaera sp. GP187 TaxID=1882752 RepID=UPI000940D94F|nr:hypothetical protein [Singulisphaera sp. GP187]
MLAIAASLVGLSTRVIPRVFPVAARAVRKVMPIPQDTAKIETRRREFQEWTRRTVREAYDKVGKQDLRWNEQAHEALELATRLFSQQVDPEVSLIDVHTPAKAAIAAGCDDPYLVYLDHRSSVGPHDPGEQEMIRRMKVAARGLAASRYPAFRRAMALQVAGTYGLISNAAGARKEAERDFDASLALLPESIAEDERNEFWEARWFENLSSLIAGYRGLDIAAPAAYERVDAKLAQIPELTVLRLQLRGYFWFHYGWEARTQAFAPNVPVGGFDTFEKHLEVAQKALNEAWKLRPDARTAEYLLEIEKGIGGDRDTMELWFDRALTADGDQYNACFTKLDWLDPKWHGTAEEMLAFGRACRATKNWRAGITLLSGDAHLRYYSKLSPWQQARYLGSPKVWPEIKSVYDEYLMHRPSDDLTRSKYAVLGYLAGRYPEAHAQFEELGDRLTAWPTFPYYPLETMKGMRSKTAAIVASKPRPEQPPIRKPDGPALQ